MMVPEEDRGIGIAGVAFIIALIALGAAVLNISNILPTAPAGTPEIASLCPAGNYATGENSTGSLGCAQVQLSQLGGSSASTCPAGQFVVNVTISASPITACAVVNWSQISNKPALVNTLSAGSHTISGAITLVNTTTIGVSISGQDVYFKVLSVPWGSLTGFPAACSIGQFVNGVGLSNTCLVQNTVPYIWLVNDSCGFNTHCSTGGTYTAYPLIQGLPKYAETDCGVLFTEMAAYLGSHFTHGAGAFVRGGVYSCKTEVNLLGSSSPYVDLNLVGAGANDTVFSFTPSHDLAVGVNDGTMSQLGVKANSHVKVAIDGSDYLNVVHVNYSNETTGDTGVRASSPNSDYFALEVDGATGTYLTGLNITTNLQDIVHFHCSYCRVGVQLVHNLGEGSELTNLLFAHTTTDILLSSGATQNVITSVLDATSTNNIVTITDNSGAINYIVTGDTYQITPTPAVALGPTRNTYGTQVTVYVEVGATNTMISKNGVALISGSENHFTLPVTLNAGETITLSQTSNVNWVWWRG